MLNFGEVQADLKKCIETKIKPGSFEITGFMLYQAQWPNFWVCRIEVKKDKQNLRYLVLCEQQGTELVQVSEPKEELDRPVK